MANILSPLTLISIIISVLATSMVITFLVWHYKFRMSSLITKDVQYR